MKKFIQSVNIKDWQIATPSGWEDIIAIHKTVPYSPIRVETESGKFIEGADKHLLIDTENNPIFIKDVVENKTSILTKDGSETVKHVYSLNRPKENMYDLELSNTSDHVFYANEILNHNTTNDGIGMRVWSHLLPGIKIATIVPRSEQLKTLGDKYQEIANAFRFRSTSSKYRNNLYYKEYPNANGLVSINRLWYILTSADKIRGNTYDWLFFDEYQDFDMSLEPEILATQSQSNWRTTRYSGTSKTTDTALEARWLESSRGYWRMKCHACNHDNYPSINYDIFKMIRPNGVCCAKCGALLNVRDGQWDFEAPSLIELGKWGFHIPQIIVPANVENRDKWLTIYKASQYMDKKSFLEEYLGEATESGSKELTVHDLQSICILGDIQELQNQANHSTPPKYLFKVGGCDWGGSDYNPATKTHKSFTAHIIIGVTPERKFDILHMKTYAGMDWDDVSHDIINYHRKFNCYALANDHGGGYVYINELQKLMNPTRLVKFKYKGPVGSTVSIPKNSTMPNLYILNRTETISALFLDIKNKRIRAPKWEQVSNYMTQCLNTTRVPITLQDGTNTLQYVRNPAKADDMLHALNYAVVLSKILLEEPLFKDEYSLKVFNEYVKYGRTPSQLSALRRTAPVSMG